MTDKTDGAPGEPRRAEGQEPPHSSPRPHAMLDLKATEVKEQPGGASASEGASRANDHTSQSQPRSMSGKTSGGALTHLLAGLAGGALVLAGVYATGGGDTTSPLQEAESSVRLAAVEKRVQALEAAPTGGGGEGGLAQKMADAEGRLARLEEGSTALKDAQGRLAGETQALAAKVGEGGTEAERARTAKLEERLDLLAEAAGSGNGQIPELAAITGKIAALEAALASQSGNGAAAQAAAERLDREIHVLKAETAQLKDRLTADLAASQGRTDKLASAVGDLESGLKRAATPGDVSAAVSPLAGKVEALEGTLDGVVQSEQDRTASARRIVLALELQNLKRTIERGQPYAAELAGVRKVSAPGVDLSALDRYSHDGVPTLPDLEREFREVMHAVLDADAEPATDSIMDRLISGAKSVVRVRKVAHPSGDTSAEAAMARIDAALKEGRIGDVIAEARAVPAKASAPMLDWLDKVEARHAVDRAIAAIEAELKASLSGTSAEPGATPAN